MEKKIVIARVQVIEGKEGDYLSLVTPLIKASKTESGNLFYSVYQDIQSESSFIVYEEYINEKAFEFHGNTALFRDFVEKVKPLLAKEIEIKII